MGFRKSNVPQEITINLRFQHIHQQENTEETFEVTHVFRMPTNGEREEYQRRLVRVKGKKLSSGLAEATRYLWKTTILRVEGYDDLPTTGDWKSYFEDPIGQIHIEEAVEKLVSYFSAEEVETLKK